jgi:hypothetical protein
MAGKYASAHGADRRPDPGIGKPEEGVERRAGSRGGEIFAATAQLHKARGAATVARSRLRALLRYTRSKMRRRHLAARGPKG